MHKRAYSNLRDRHATLAMTENKYVIAREHSDCGNPRIRRRSGLHKRAYSNLRDRHATLAMTENKYVIAREHSDRGNPRNNGRSGCIGGRTPIFGGATTRKGSRNDKKQLYQLRGFLVARRERGTPFCHQCHCERSEATLGRVAPSSSRYARHLSRFNGRAYPKIGVRTDMKPLRPLLRGLPRPTRGLAMTY